MLRDYYRKSHGKYPSAARMLNLFSDRYSTVKYSKKSYLKALAKLHYEDYTKPYLDYFNLIDDLMNAIKSAGYTADDDDILEALKPGVVKLCEHDRNELNQITTLTEFKKWIIKEVRIQRVPSGEEVQIPKSLFRGLNHPQADASGTKNKQKQYYSKHGQPKSMSQSKKDSTEKKNVHNFNLNNHNVISDLELMGGTPMSSEKLPSFV